MNIAGNYSTILSQHCCQFIEVLRLLVLRLRLVENDIKILFAIIHNVIISQLNFNFAHLYIATVN